MVIKYRSEIDGLRALAVIPVIFFHAGFDLFSGGFVGVDIFFVISGYLITTIVIKELNNGKFSILKFYERRARRILPVLFFVIIISSIISFILLTRSELASYFKSVISSLLFYSNYHFYKHTPYFKSESDFEPLLHTWSLSIEEQFYIIFPLIMLVFYKFFKQHILLLFFVVFTFSLFICQFLAMKTGGTLNFYFTLSRIWEISLGSLCAYFIIHKKLSFSILSKNFFSTIGVTFILIPVFFFDNQTKYPSLYTLIPTFGTVLIILFADKETFVKKILSIKSLVGIGLISYSLYMWHQPLLAFGRIFFDDFSITKKFISLILSLLLSILSYHFIEKFFRNREKINFKVFFKTGSISLIILATISFINVNFFSSKNSTEALMAKILLEKNAVYLSKMNERLFIKNRIIHENLKPKILVIGSSRIMEISNKNFDQQVLQLGVSGASIEDQIAITLMALEKFNVDKILLSADPWLFNKYNNQFRWKAISDEYQLSLKNIRNNKKDKITKKIIYNDKYIFYEKFLETLYGFLNIRKLDLEVKESEINNLTKRIILRDGKRIVNRKSTQNLKVKLIEYSMEKYEFSEENYKIYESFIEYLINIYQKKVILILSPYHYPSYQFTINTKPFYLDLEKEFIELGKRTGAETFGSYNASLIPCDENEFNDYFHAKDTCILKITEKINKN